MYWALVTWSIYYPSRFYLVEQNVGRKKVVRQYPLTLSIDARLSDRKKQGDKGEWMVPLGSCGWSLCTESVLRGWVSRRGMYSTSLVYRAVLSMDRAAPGWVPKNHLTQHWGQGKSLFIFINCRLRKVFGDVERVGRKLTEPPLRHKPGWHKCRWLPPTISEASQKQVTRNHHTKISVPLSGELSFFPLPRPYGWLHLMM